MQRRNDAFRTQPFTDQSDLGQGAAMGLLTRRAQVENRMI